ATFGLEPSDRDCFACRMDNRINFIGSRIIRPQMRERCSMTAKECCGQGVGGKVYLEAPAGNSKSLPVRMACPAIVSNPSLTMPRAGSGSAQTTASLALPRRKLLRNIGAERAHRFGAGTFHWPKAWPTVCARGQASRFQRGWQMGGFASLITRVWPY